MKPISFVSKIAVVALLLAAAGLDSAPAAETDAVGFNKVECLSNSDTIVSIPFHRPPQFVGPMSSNPSVNGGSATISVANVAWTTNQFANGFYIRMIEGSRKGYWYGVTSNTATSLTIALNGDNFSGVASGNRFKLIPHYTLNSLFPPGNQTTIVASAGNLSFHRRTELFFPDLTSNGINLAASARYFLHSTNGWQKDVSGFPAAGGDVIPPDTFFTIRHPSSAGPTNFAPADTVEAKDLTIPLATQASGPQDNFVALIRPIPLTLDQTNLAQSGAFVASTGNLSFQRMDELLVFDNTVPGINKAASARYFLVGTEWRKDVAGFPAANSDQVFKPGTGVIIRKAAKAGGTTDFWTNQATY